MKPTKSQTVRNLVRALALLELKDQGAEFPIHVEETSAIYIALLYLGLSKLDIKDKVDTAIEEMFENYSFKGVF